MAIAIGLLVLLAFTVIFHFASPWWFTPIASNWKTMDDTIVLTFWVTGIVFIAVTVFMIYCVVKYRYAEDRQAAYEPEHKTLENWLLILTTIGVIVLLAPGLKVWGNYINVPDDAHEIEVVAQQWQWSYRYPGEDEKLGTANFRHVTAENPLGINPDDPNGQDDLVIIGSELHLPIDKPIKVLMRSKDVLHDFYVPQFRAKMDIVPGLVNYLWLTPTKEGRFEVLCAELCGVGHYNMRSHVVVESPDEYAAWLDQQTVVASAKSSSVTNPLIIKGREVAQSNGCLGCHSIDGSKMLGPTWKGMIGKMEELADGTSILVDEDYIIESTTNPNEKIVKGYPAIMPAANLSNDDLTALMEFVKSLSVSEQQPEATESIAPPPVLSNDTNDSSGLVEQGRQLAQQRGCIACHTLDGSAGVGPSWLGLYGSNKELVDGSKVVADETYLSAAINQPANQIVKGFPAIMPPAGLNETEVEAVIAFIKEQSQ